MVADDDPMLRMLVRETLGRGAFDFLEASDGVQALAVARQHQLALALLDVEMPGLTGLEVCRQLCHEGSSLPVVMLTAQARPADREAGLAAGASDYLTKPFRPMELLDLIERLLPG